MKFQHFCNEQGASVPRFTILVSKNSKGFNYDMKVRADSMDELVDSLDQLKKKVEGKIQQWKEEVKE